MDKTVKPANDFFRYVNGTWLDNTEIPSDRTRWGSFDELRQKTDADALAMKEAATNPKYKSDTDQGKAINLYKTILDTIGRNKLGITPLKPYLKKLMQSKHKRLTSLINRNGTLRRDWFLCKHWSRC
jgi:predicted metalloendopeptidase